MEYASVTAYHIVPPLPLPAVDTAVKGLDLLLARALDCDYSISGALQQNYNKKQQFLNFLKFFSNFYLIFKGSHCPPADRKKRSAVSVVSLYNAALLTIGSSVRLLFTLYFFKVVKSYSKKRKISQV